MHNNIFRTYDPTIKENNIEELDEALLSNLGVKMKIATTKDHKQLPGLVRLLKQKGEDQKGMDGWTKIASNRHKKLSGKEMPSVQSSANKPAEPKPKQGPSNLERTLTKIALGGAVIPTPDEFEKIVARRNKSDATSAEKKPESKPVSKKSDSEVRSKIKSQVKADIEKENSEGDNYTIRDKFTLNKYSSERLEKVGAHLQKLRDGDKSHKDTERNVKNIVFNALHHHVDPKHHEHIRHYVNGNHDKYNSQIKAALDKGSEAASGKIEAVLDLRDAGIAKEPKNEGFNPAYLMQMSESRKRHLQEEDGNRLHPSNWPLKSLDTTDNNNNNTTKTKRIVKRVTQKTRKAFTPKKDVQMSRKSVGNLLRYSKPEDVDDARKTLENAFGSNPRLINKPNPIANELLRRQVDPEHHEHIPYYLGGSHMDIPNDAKGSLNMGARVSLKQIDKFNQSEYGTRDIDPNKVTNRFM